MDPEQPAHLLAAGVLAFIETVTVRMIDNGWDLDDVSTAVSQFVAAGYLGVETSWLNDHVDG